MKNSLPKSEHREDLRLTRDLYAVSPASSLSQYVHSSLIHEVYLTNDLKSDFPRYWGVTGMSDSGFDLFFQGIKELSLKVSELADRQLNHDETLDELILPVLNSLGWEKAEVIFKKNLLITDKNGDGLAIKPTALLFKNESESNSFFTHFQSSSKPVPEINTIPVSTSYFGSWSELKSGKHDKSREQYGKFGDMFTTLGNDEQTYNYLTLLGSEWGFSTDGHSWRLIKKSAFSIDHNKFFEFNLWSFLNSLATARPHEEDALIEILKHFYWFFSKESHQLSKPNQISLTWERSQRYADNIEDDLRARFVAAMSIAVNGVWDGSKENNISLDLTETQNLAESLIYNTLFIRSCESRRILPLHQTYLPVSLHNLVSKLRDFEPSCNDIPEATNNRLESIFSKKLDQDGHEIFHYLINLFELTNDSKRKSEVLGFSIEGFTENFFADSDWSLIKRIKLNNLSLAKVLSTLFYFDVNVQIPFNILTPQQFGSIFESFLEFKLSKVTRTQYLVRRSKRDKKENSTKIDISWEDEAKATDSVLFVAKRGSIYFRPDKSDRKISGSYYTPDHIVDDLVSEILGPITKALTAENILKLKVFDPAMGSGHFLISALRYLTKAYLKKIENEMPRHTDAKRKILHNCIYGVDLNERAVKLCKLALWLETAEPGQSLEPLDDQLRCKNSLIEDDTGFLRQGTDVVIGNPPWGSATFEVDKLSSDIRGTVSEKNINSFELFLRKSKSWCSKNGKIGFILPRNVIRKNQYSDLRKSILPNLSVIKDLGKFPGVLQEACSVILSGSKSENFIFQEFNSLNSNEEKIEFGDRISIEKEKIKSPDFIFQPGKADSLDEIVRILQQHPKFSDLFAFSRGIELGKSGEMSECPKCKRLSSPPKKKNRNGTFEKTCECGSKITLATKRVKIISDKRSPGYYPIIAGPDIQPDKVNVSRYIKLNVGEINYKKNLFKPKSRIYIPMNNDRIVAAYENDGSCLALKTVYVASPKENTISLSKVVKALNSEIISFYFEYCINNGATLTNSISTDNLGSIPIPKFSESKAESLSECYGLSESQMNEIRSFLKKRRPGNSKKREKVA